MHKLMQRLPIVMAIGIGLVILWAVEKNLWPSIPPQSAPSQAAATPAVVAPKPAAPEDPKLAQYRAQLRALIGEFGYNCQQLEQVTNVGEGPYGLEFRVLCSTGLFQVISRPNNRWSVTTWAHRLK
jgi:hypothetical protein